MPRWSEGDESKAVKLAAEGYQLAEIAAAVRRPVGATWAKLGKLGIRMPNPKYNRPPATTAQQAERQKTALDALAKAWG